MSDFSTPIKNALYTKLNVSGVTSLATGGVWYKEAGSTTYPFLIFEKVSSVPTYSFGLTLQLEDSLWNLKAYADRDSSTTKSPVKLADDIIAASVTAIGQSLTLSSGTCLGVMRMGDLPEIKQPLSDRNIWMTGVMLRIWAR